MSKYQTDAKTHLKSALRVANRAEVADFGTDPAFWMNVVRDIRRVLENFEVSTSRDRRRRSPRRGRGRSTPTQSGRRDHGPRGLQVGDRVVSRHDDDDVGEVVEIVGRRPGEAARVRWSVARATYLEDPDDLRRVPSARSRGPRRPG